MPRPCLKSHEQPDPAGCPVCAGLAREDDYGAAFRAAFDLAGRTPVAGHTPASPPAARPAKPRVPKGCGPCHGNAPEGGSGVMLDRCDQARAGLTAAQMAGLIKEAPPGPWPDGWAGWDCTRDAFLLLLEEAIAALPPYPEGKYEGRGIVVSVNAKPGHSSGKYLPEGYLPGAWCLVKELRRHGCTLPVTFAHLGALEWDRALARLVAPLGVSMLDLREIEHAGPARPRILSGWESKPYAVLHSPYEEALYLDADNLPLADPSFLFDTAQYRYYGSVFWPDVPPYDRNEWLPECVWKNVGLAYRDEVDFESGQFLTHKRKCWRETCLSMWLNEHSDYFYKFIFGDKSTYHLAWARLGTNWSIPQKGPGGNQASLVQHNFDGSPLFQHLTRNKPSLGGFPSPGSLIPRTECETHLAELRSLWHGRLWDQSDQSDLERALQADLEGVTFRYARHLPSGAESRPLRLLEDGRVGRGLAKCEVSWSSWIDGTGPFLVLKSIDDVPTAILRPDGNGGWAGRWLEHERCSVTLSAEAT